MFKCGYHEALIDCLPSATGGGRDLDLREGDCDQVGGRHPGVQGAPQEQGHEGAEKGREGRAGAAAAEEREQQVQGRLQQSGEVVNRIIIGGLGIN